MPTYDYRCPSGHDSEHFYRKISDATAEVRCPVCGEVAVRRVSGGAGLVFKGSGFYLTDYGKNAHRKPAADGAKAGKQGDGTSDAKAETPKAESGAPAGGSEKAPAQPAAPSDNSKGGGSKPASTKSKSGDGQ